jgi:protein ImuA
MTQPVTPFTLHSRAAVAEEFRRLLPRMEGLRATNPLPLGVSEIDCCLPHGGLACGALHEVVPDAGATPAAFGFMTALLGWVSSQMQRSPGRPVFLVLPAYGLRDYGRPYGRGLHALGLDPDGLILVETDHRKDTLWAMEEALRSRVPAAVAGVIDKLDLKTSQRLQLTAADCAVPLFLLRPAEILEASAAATRWRVGALPAARDRFGLITQPHWHLMLERCRNGRTGEWIVEYDHVAHRFSVATAMADPTFPGGTGEEPFRHAS